ncbi:MAG: hypothetical protein HQL01_14420, partial [Nitrospirae bacterium]|nr:hypothetical protein [Nitrospirota bacterium]
SFCSYCNLTCCPVFGVHYTPDGKRLISGSWDMTLKQWDIETGKEIRSFIGHKNWVTTCIITPDGKRLISGSLDNTLKQWDIETGKEIRSFIGHKNRVTTCIITPDGKRLISGSWDKTLKQWDIETGKEIATIELLWYVNDIKFSKTNPNVIITANANGTLTSLDLSKYL